MTFKLLIECSKDIDKLKIDFSDGSSCITTSDNKESARDISTNSEKESQKDIRKQDKFLNTDTDYSSVSQEVVRLPDIDRTNRPVKVATELQNLDI